MQKKVTRRETHREICNNQNRIEWAANGTIVAQKPQQKNYLKNPINTYKTIRRKKNVFFF